MASINKIKIDDTNQYTLDASTFKGIDIMPTSGKITLTAASADMSSPTSELINLSGIRDTTVTAGMPGIGMQIPGGVSGSLKLTSDGFKFYNNDQSAYRDVYGSVFYGALSGNAATATTATSAGSATKATQDESGNNIKSTYAASFSISDHTITLKNKNGVSLGTVTVPDNNTWKANTASSEGYVSAGSGYANKVWKTDDNGTPGWRTDANTTYGVVSTSANGLAPKITNTAGFLKGNGTWVVPTDDTKVPISSTYSDTSSWPHVTGSFTIGNNRNNSNNIYLSSNITQTFEEGDPYTVGAGLELGVNGVILETSSGINASCSSLTAQAYGYYMQTTGNQFELTDGKGDCPTHIKFYTNTDTSRQVIELNARRRNSTSKDGEIKILSQVVTVDASELSILSRNVSYKDLVITDGSTTTTYKVLCGT